MSIRAVKGESPEETLKGMVRGRVSEGSNVVVFTVLGGVGRWFDYRDRGFDVQEGLWRFLRSSTV